jgi:hypothetical protein
VPAGGISSRLLRPGMIPQGVPQIDWTDPINDGLLYLSLPGLGFFDLSDNGQNGTPSGTITTAPSRFGNAAVFNGSNSYISLPTGGAIYERLNYPFTVNIIGSLANATSIGVALCLASVASGAKLQIGTAAGEGLLLSINQSGFPYVPYAAFAIGVPQLWTLVVYSSSSADFYLDGVPPALTGSDYFTNPPSGNYLGVGGSVLNRYFAGRVAQVRIANGAWTQGRAMELAAHPFRGLVFPSDRLWLWGAGSGGVAVNVAAPLATEAVADIARAAALPQETLRRLAAAADLAAEFPATVAPEPALPAEWTARRLRAVPVPAEWLHAAGGVAATTPAEALAALAAGAMVAVESGGSLSLIVAAAAALPVEWRQAALCLSMPLARLLASPGRLRILAGPARRRLLASAGRLRTLKPSDR